MRLSRSSVIAAATVLAGGWLAACSKPTTDASPVAVAPTRDVRLVELTAPEAPQVSDLEAGRPVQARHTMTHEQPVAAEPVAQARVNPVAVLELDRGPAVSTMAGSVVESPHVLVQAPAAADEPVSLVDHGLPSYSASPSYSIEPSYGRRGPSVIIRGGRGGLDDDCDLTRPGGHHGPVAIHQIAPPRSRGGSIGGPVPQFGARSTGGSFGRGGIR